MESPLRIEPVADNGGDAASALLFDWDKLCIVDTVEDNVGAVIPVVGEDAIYELLGYSAPGAAEDDQSVRNDSDKDDRDHDRDADLDRDDDLDIDDALGPVQDDVPSEATVQYDKENPPMIEGSQYNSMWEFKMALRQHAIDNQFSVKTEKAESDRFRGYCKAEGCSWRIVARLMRDGKSVRVTVNKVDHSCATSGRVEGDMANYHWVAERAIPILKENPNMGASEMLKVLESKYPVKLKYRTVWLGRMKASDKVFGSWEQSFELLFRFKAEVELRCPGSVVEIEVQDDGENKFFHRFFCCFKPSIDGFLNGCRPYISIDSTALNGRWCGHLASATALDGHNWMFPLAFGYIDAETTDNWTWFMEQLKKSIGNPPNLAISSDACKGLETAIKHVYPWAEHRECFRHLMDNFIKKFQGPVYGNMYPAARAFRSDRFQHYMSKIHEACSDVGPWLARYHSLLWMRSRFSEEIKCDYITNNLAESWNNWVKEIKDLPVAELADTIRIKTMELYERRRRLGHKLQGVMLPAVVHQLNAITRSLSRLKVTSAGGGIGEVSEINEDLEVMRHVVHLDKHECTCREWQVSGKPCPHALVLITSMRNFIMDDYLHPYFSLRSFRLAYASIIPALTDKSQWPFVDLGYVVLPPKTKISAGRQRKKRFLGCLEKGKGKGKGKWQVQCKGCGELGHRQASSKCHLTGTKKRKTSAKRGPKQGASSTTPRRNNEATNATTSHSPGPVTRRQLARSLVSGEGSSQTPPRANKRQRTNNTISTPPRITRATSKKLTPKKPSKKL